MIYNNLAEWSTRGEDLFGNDYLDWTFVCPACGKISKGLDFKEAGASPDDMYNTCIGRHNGKGVNSTKFKNGKTPPFGCDWAAFGLLGTLGKGDIIMMDGRKVDVFPFYDAQAETGE